MPEEPARNQPELLTVAPESPDTPCYFLSLTVENIRTFGPAQTLNLSDPDGRPCRWTILLGDNGSGKTTILQTIAALTPQKYPERDKYESPEVEAALSVRFPDIFLRPDAVKYHTFRRTDSTGYKVASRIAYGGRLVDLGSETREIALNLTMVFTGDFPHAGSCSNIQKPIEKLTIYGYGATRRIGSAKLSEIRGTDPQATLFDDNCPLLNAEEWLLQADYAATKSQEKKAVERLGRIKSILVQLLPDVEAIRIEPRGTETPIVEAQTHYGWVPLRSLSSGYRSVVAWMVDLASRLFDRYPNSPDPLAEPAIVLVDQIDVYLHPKWQRDLIKNLTGIFKNTQFIVTAHSPLIVQSAPGANIAVLRREGDHTVIDQSHESVKGWRLDQIVASDLFDVGSRDPETEALLEERGKLLAKPSLTPDDEARLKILNEKADALPYGENEEERKAMEIIRRAAKKLENRAV